MEIYRVTLYGHLHPLLRSFVMLHVEYRVVPMSYGVTMSHDVNHLIKANTPQNFHRLH